MNKEIFNEVLDSFENDDIKEFAKNCIDSLEPWFMEAPAASSGRFHPQTSLGEGGLSRHTISVVRFLNYMLEIESIKNQFTSRERDLMRVAALMHDSKKSGSQEDYEQNKQTKFDHPLLAARSIMKIPGELSREERIFIGKAIASHMGQFNTSKKAPDVVLPKPEEKYQIIVHCADYLASRKDVEMRFDMMPEYKKTTTEIPDINTWTFPFGKHQGKTIAQVYETDKGYIKWAKDNMQKEPARSLINQFVAQH